MSIFMRRQALEVRFAEVAICALVSALMGIGCGGARVPVVTYNLEPLVITPVGGPGTTDASREFADLFCSTLQHLEGETWGECDEYFEPGGQPNTPLGPIPSRYRLLVIPGIFGQCIEPVAKTFETAIAHLSDAHGVHTDYVSVSATGSTRHNAEQIADYLRQGPRDADTPRYIAFGYSKGASDLLEALGTHDVARRDIAAAVSVAGTVSGSRLSDGLPKDLLGVLSGMVIGPCDIGDGGGIDSLRRDVRLAALRAAQMPEDLKTYSLAAVSEPDKTSRILQNGWKQLSAYSREQDSQVIRQDAILPGSTYLGTAKADHWAVALPFEDADVGSRLGNRLVVEFVDQNHFPRTALFEAIVRFVLRELP